ncbi:Histone-lysine N-methyltransferase SETMAR [Vespula squamosa]|uniref:Histone-lysine N-methyltransferase SETMAR n=1 Tax=Vespula squamosa TaxID=30214 RepID=A0ABD2BGA5_VESSQ
MEEQDVHFKHILFYYFRKGKNASQTQKKLCAVYGNEALKERHRDEKFYEHGILTLPERWEKVIDKNGQYLID